MSVSTINRKAGPFAGNGIQTVFPFAFKVFTTADVLVVRATGGVETTLVLATDYTVALNADQDNAPGGSITLLVPLAVGQTLAATSAVAALQPVTVTTGGGFFPTVFNGVFDRLTILVQQLAEKVGRSFTVAITSTVTNLNLPVVPSGVLQWSPDGTQILAVTLPDLSLSLALPPQGGHANHPLFSNGAAAGWRAIAITDVTGLQGALNYCVAAAGSVPTLAQVQAAVQQGIAQGTAAQAAFLLNAAVIF